MKHKAKYAVLLITLSGVLLLAGCGDKNSMTGKAEYIKFLGDRFSAISSNLQEIKTSLSGFTEEKLSDASWVSSLNSKLDKVDQSVSDIVSYDGVPDDFTEFNDKLKDMAYQLKLTVVSYKTGIANKDYSALQSANEQMQSASAAMQERINELKGYFDAQK